MQKALYSSFYVYRNDPRMAFNEMKTCEGAGDDKLRQALRSKK